jgi:hypothetical protein
MAIQYRVRPMLQIFLCSIDQSEIPLRQTSVSTLSTISQAPLVEATWAMWLVVRNALARTC